MSTVKVDPMVKARTALVMDHPFFAVLAMRTKLKVDKTCDTGWCDGFTVGYNPDFAAKLTQQQCVAFLIHEMYHKVFMHHLRKGSRDHAKWNVAADYAINALIKQIPGADLHPDWLYDQKYEGMSAEEIYDKLPPMKQIWIKLGGDKGGNNEGNDPGKCGEVRDPDADGEGEGKGMSREEMEGRIIQDIAQAVHVAKLRGKLPAGMDIHLDELLEPQVPWKDQLRRFMTERARSEYSWSRPNRRFVAEGLYLPAMIDENAAGEFVFGIDTSGSMYGEPLLACVSEVNAVMEEVQPQRSYVLYTDAEVARADIFERGEPLEVRPAGGGGTDFRPVFDWVEENNVKPKCLIYITDGYGAFPDHAPPYPVLWVMTEDVEPPFGEVLRITV